MIERLSSASPFEPTIGFCRALRTGDRVLVSGTAPIGPDGRTVEGDVRDQMRRCLTIITEAVRRLGGVSARVIRTRMFLTHRDDWPAVGEVHGEFFAAADARPVATMVVVAGLLDEAWRVEVEAEAVVPAITVHAAGGEERAWISSHSASLFGAAVVVSRGRLHEPASLPALLARRDGQWVGLATYDVTDQQCELVTIDALVPWQGVGTALLAEVERCARAAGCRRLWLITTNDNLDALQFYQRRGFTLSAVYPNALEESRRLKPSIPRVGQRGIPLRDELELEKTLEGE